MFIKSVYLKAVELITTIYRNMWLTVIKQSELALLVKYSTFAVLKLLCEHLLSTPSQDEP